MKKENNLSLGLLSERLPETFHDLNNERGSFLYNHNIYQVSVLKDDEGGITVIADDEDAPKMYRYDSLRCDFAKNADNIFAELLASHYTPSKESKLLNEYNSAEIGLLSEEYKTPYEEFLLHRLTMRNMVIDDCVTFNIPVGNE